ncbi:ribosomal protein S5 domain 2-like protein [Polyplosphaeria fusca]|uniref:Ribosomal RNA-processing protein 41 n=1 Tax=Polyplosphaeria fusca TaxID=682080 RepID=A0A9P4QU03_9PLEO|nr:ribosomal protein S5 domain 2-like protein [Polyplosphaeria fusca]
MPLDTSTYSLALLRLDGRRWNELRRLHAQISVQAAASGSSYLEMGNTKILCTVSGPSEARRGAGGGGAGSSEGNLEVDVSFAGFSGVERRKRRQDKRTTDLSHTLTSSLTPLLHLHLYPHSTITLTLSILSQDGSLLAACINSATLALIDAGVPMTDYLTAVTCASSPSTSDEEAGDPLLDVNSAEEQELPFLTLGTVGREGRVGVCVMESRVRGEGVEGMVAVGIEGCARVREIVDGVVRGYGKRFA